MSSGSSRADNSVEPTRSQNITVSCRRSAAGLVRGVLKLSVSDRRLGIAQLCDRVQQLLAMPE